MTPPRANPTATRFRPLPVLAGIAAALCLASCQSLVDQAKDPEPALQRIQAHLSELDSRLAEHQDQLQAKRSALLDQGRSATDPAVQEADAAISETATARQAIASATQRVALLHNDLASVSRGEGTAGAALQVLSTLIPEPIRSPIVLGLGLAAALWRAFTLRRGLASVARGIEKARQQDAQFERSFKANANTFRAIQTPTAQRIIEQTVQGPSPLRMPI